MDNRGLERESDDHSKPAHSYAVPMEQEEMVSESCPGERGDGGFHFDDCQERVIEAEGGYFLVLASPGCGKTEVLSERIVRAKRRGVALEDMVCLSFTNRASREMMERVSDKVGDDVGKVFVGNIHRFCHTFLIQHHFMRRGACVLSDDEMRAVIRSICAESGSNDLARRPDEIEDINNFFSQRQLGHPMEAFNSYKEEYEAYYQLAMRVGMDAGADFSGARSEEAITMTRIVLRYRTFKREHGVMTFTDLLVLAYERLRRDREGRYKRYKWVEVDEVQDLNRLQIAVVDELSDTTGQFTVMYLGDEQQAIFSFAGADFRVLDNLRDRCRGRIMTLSVNHRSPNYLLDMLNRYATKNLGVTLSSLPHSHIDIDKTKDALRIIRTSDVSQYSNVARIVRQYMAEDGDSRTAIIVNSNKVADEISNTLSVNKISHYKISGAEVTDSREYKAVSALLSVCANEFDNLSWARLIYWTSPEGIFHNMRRAIELTAVMRSLALSPMDLMSDEPYTAAFLRSYAEGEEMVVFDTETTGTDIFSDDIVQIAALKIRGGKKVAGSDFNIFLETRRDIPEMLGDMVNPLRKAYADNPHLSRQVGLALFLQYIGDDALIGHNVNFDYHILKHNVERALQGTTVGRRRVWDTLKLIRLVEPRLPSYRLGDIMESLSLITKNYHLADEDVAATRALVDYCAGKTAAVTGRQRALLARKDVAALAASLRCRAKPFLDDMAGRLYSKGCAHVAFADEVERAYSWLKKQGMVTANHKIDIMIRYMREEWTDSLAATTLKERLARRVGMMTSLKEADLVNTRGLIDCRLFIMTIHKAKGLEFENVIIPNAYDGIYPYYINTRYHLTGAIREDARKLYVALSRAKKRLCVIYPVNIYFHPTELSPFISEICDAFLMS